MTAVRAALAALVVVVMGAAILGIGMGSAPAERTSPPAGAQLAASRARMADGGPLVRRGRALFEDEGCDRCHAMAAIGADGALGPRLDRLDDEDAEDVAESISDPRDDIADGFPAELMPTDYAERLSSEEIRTLAALVAAASGGEAEEGEEDGGSGRRGRGRNRGRGGGG